jgi:hypothetical protein
VATPPDPGAARLGAESAGAWRPRTPGLAAGNNAAPRFAGEDGEYSSNVILSTDARVRVQVGGKAIGKWTIQAAPDTPPTIALTAKPSRTEQLATKFAFKGDDDYGIAKVHAVLMPKGGHGKPLVVDLPLPGSNATMCDQNSYVRPHRPSLCRSDGGWPAGSA